MIISTFDHIFTEMSDLISERIYYKPQRFWSAAGQVCAESCPAASAEHDVQGDKKQAYKD